MDFGVATCELKVAWKSSNEEVRDLEFTLEFAGISVNYVEIFIDNNEGILLFLTFQITQYLVKLALKLIFNLTMLLI